MHVYRYNQPEMKIRIIQYLFILSVATVISAGECMYAVKVLYLVSLIDPGPGLIKEEAIRLSIWLLYHVLCM